MLFQGITDNYMTNCRLSEGEAPQFTSEGKLEKTSTDSWFVDFRMHASATDLIGQERRVTIPKDKACKNLMKYIQDLIELSQTQTQPFWFSNKV